MKKRSFLAVAAVVVTGALAGGAVAIAGGSDSEGGATGPGAHRAVKAALAATGGGTANSVELDGENGAKWEVEVTKPDGDTVDVRLSDTYQVIVIEGDGEGNDGNDGGG